MSRLRSIEADQASLEISPFTSDWKLALAVVIGSKASCGFPWASKKANERVMVRLSLLTPGQVKRVPSKVHPPVRKPPPGAAIMKLPLTAPSEGSTMMETSSPTASTTTWATSRLRRGDTARSGAVAESEQAPSRRARAPVAIRRGVVRIRHSLVGVLFWQRPLWFIPGDDQRPFPLTDPERESPLNAVCGRHPSFKLPTSSFKLPLVNYFTMSRPPESPPPRPARFDPPAPR
jgi:hypothetical protein